MIILAVAVQAYADENQFYTVLAGSYSSVESAEQDYERLQNNVAESLQHALRIELVGGYYTIRVGQFLEHTAAEQLLPAIEKYFKGARVLKAFIRTERVLKSNGPLVSNSSLPSKQLSNELMEQLAGEKFYTVQFGSFSLEESAAEEFERLRAMFINEPLPWLRIEKIQSFHTIRAGKFKAERTADDFASYLSEKNSHSSVLRAYIKPERLVSVLWHNGEGGWEDKPTEQIASDLQEIVVVGGEKEETAPDEELPLAVTLAESTDLPETVVLQDLAETTDLPETGARQDNNASVVKMLVPDKKKQKVTKTQKDLLNSLDVDPGQEFFTVQIASFSEAALATIEYESFLSRLSPVYFEQLRIEFIKGFFTVRVGKFDRRAPSQELLDAIKSYYPQASVIYAYIIPQRIQRLYGDDSAQIFSQQIYEDLPGHDALQEDNKSVDEEIDLVDTERKLDGDTDDVILVTPANIELPVEDIKVNGAEDTVVEKPMLEGSAESGDPEPTIIDSEQTLLDGFVEADDQVATLNRSEEESSEDTAEDTAEEKIPEFTYEVLTVLTKDDKGENIRMPSSLFYDNSTDELYLINGVNNRLIIYGPDFFPQNSIGKGRGLDSPLSGYFTNDGKVFVTQAGTPTSKPRLTLLNTAFFPEKELLMQDIPESDNFIPQNLALAKDNSMYITGLSSRRILVLDKNGSFKKWFSVAVDKRGDYVFSDATEPDDIAEIKDIEIDPDGNIIVLSESTSKVYVFDSEERFLFAFGKKGGAEGKLSRPRAVAFDSNLRCFYVVDYMRHTVLIYDINGEFKYEFGGRGWGPEWFNYPVDIVIGRQGNVVVADFFNQRAQVFEVKYRDAFPEKSAEKWGLPQR
nr:SPOR domain-containing protein [Desulfobulbaceae bacterium]